MARKIQDFYCDCDYAFLERKFDGYVYNINKPEEPRVTEIEGFKRCSNFALNAFDIKVDEKVYGSVDIKDYLKEQGYRVIDFYVQNKIIENFRNNYQELTKDDMTDNLKAIYYPAWNTMNVNSFCSAFKSRGSFVIGTAGSHTLAYVKNKLWDSQGKGFNKSKIVLGFQVLTQDEYDAIPNLKDLTDREIRDFLFNLTKVDQFPKVVKEQRIRLKENYSLEGNIERLIPSFVKAAQEIYDEWDESDEDTYAGGGICHFIAEEIASICNSKIRGVLATVYTYSDVQHVVTIVGNSSTNECYAIDIPYRIYEKGGGYSWTKIPNVKFDNNDVLINQVDYNEFFDESGELYEAKYKGKKVTLNKPTKGDRKKYKVFITNPKTGNVKKIEFGDPDMEIKRDDPEKRKSFRARHKCKQKKDKTTAGYWSCKLWGNKPVSDIMKGESFNYDSYRSPSVSIYMEHQEFLFYVDELYGYRNLKEFSVPSWIKSKVPVWIKDQFYFIKELAVTVKADFFQLLNAFRDTKVYKLFKLIEWNLDNMWDLVKKGFKAYEKLQKDIAKWVAESQLGQEFINDIKAFDEFFEKHPWVKNVAGPVVAGILIFIWLNMTFTGDFNYDFDLSSVILALTGKYTLYKFFGSEDGIRMLILLATGVLLSLSFPWPGPDSIKYLTAVVVSLINYAKGSEEEKVKKVSDDKLEDEIEAAEEILDLKSESVMSHYHSLYDEGVKYKYVIRDRKKVRKPYTDNPNKKIVYVDDKPKEVIKTSKEKRNRKIGSKKAVKKAKKKQGMALKKRKLSLKKRTWDK